MSGRILVIGQTSVGRRVCGLLNSSGLSTIHLDEPSDAELRAALTSDVDGIAVMLHDDIKALRYSLAAHHIRPDARLFVAMFDRTAREQLRNAVPTSVVLSPAAISVPSLVAAAIAPQSAAIRRKDSQDLKQWVAITPTGHDISPRRYRTTKLRTDSVDQVSWAGSPGNCAPTTPVPKCCSPASSG